MFSRGRDKWEALCTIYKAGTYVSVANKGCGDLETHIVTAKHRDAVRGGEGSSKLTDFFVQPGKTEDAAHAAVGAFAFHTVKHHHSYRLMDCTSALLKRTFTDSANVKKFSSACTKTEAIVNGVLAPHSVDTTLEALQDIPYTVKNNL
ncbi:hypothetical protein M9458_053582 [Cirrhinus mrigala]|uniref:Uncharacterized protein n=1 Tax=Cirrhinus mrigala TaxID=683832 RepID=A0ABD0MME8_CIRMR